MRYTELMNATNQGVNMTQTYYVVKPGHLFGAIYLIVGRFTDWTVNSADATQLDESDAEAYAHQHGAYVAEVR
jgi:hypothetical protein